MSRDGKFDPETNHSERERELEAQWIARKLKIPVDEAWPLVGEEVLAND